MPPPLPPPDRVRTVAVRLTNWVGDVVMNTPFLARLRETYPLARIVALGRANVTGLLENHPAIDDLWTVADGTARGFLDAASKLRALRPDVGYLLPNATRAALLFLAGGVPARVGYDRDGRGLLLTHPVRLRPEDLAVHEVRYYLRLLDAHFPRHAPPPPLALSVSEGEIAAMREWLANEGIAPGDMVVGVNPAAYYGTAKRWDAAGYRAVAEHFAATCGAHVVVTGLPREKDVAASVCEGARGHFINAAGRMSLRQLMAFLALTDLFLTNDSGAMHIAAALGTPLVAIFGSTDWVTTAPISPRARIVRVETECAPCLLRDCPIDHRCMTRVKPPMVIAAAEELLRSLAEHGAPTA